VTSGPHHYPLGYQGGHARNDGRGKMTLEGRVGLAHPERAVLGATCVTVVVVTSAAEHRDSFMRILRPESSGVEPAIAGMNSWCQTLVLKDDFEQICQ
jgi:hypothetical protein